MNSYTVQYKGKKYHYAGKSVEDVAEKFRNRKVFGNCVVYGLSLKQYDAETRGEKWGQYRDSDGNEIMIESNN